MLVRHVLLFKFSLVEDQFQIQFEGFQVFSNGLLDLAVTAKLGNLSNDVHCLSFLSCFLIILHVNPARVKGQYTLIL